MRKTFAISPRKMRWQNTKKKSNKPSFRGHFLCCALLLVGHCSLPYCVCPPTGPRLCRNCGRRRSAPCLCLRNERKMVKLLIETINFARCFSMPAGICRAALAYLATNKQLSNSPPSHKPPCATPPLQPHGEHKCN